MPYFTDTMTTYNSLSWTNAATATTTTMSVYGLNNAWLQQTPLAQMGLNQQMGLDQQMGPAAQAIHEQYRAERAIQYERNLAYHRAVEAQQLAENERQAATLAAKARARELLLGFLNEEQRADFEAGRGFVVVGKSGAEYRVKPFRSGNIAILDKKDRKPTATMCIHPDDPTIPVEDVMLAQLLHLQHDDTATRRRANITRLA